MEAAFYWIGVALCISAGVAATAFVVGLALDYIWRKVRDAAGLAWTLEAMREYRKVKPPPLRGEDE